MVGELWAGASRLSASLKAYDRPQLGNQWRLAWVVVFAVALTACSGTPSSRSSTSSSASARPLASASSVLSSPGQVQPSSPGQTKPTPTGHVQPTSPGQTQPTSNQSSPGKSITVPNMIGMSLAQAKAALNAADAGPYSWLYGCYGSSNIGLVVRQTPAGGTQIPRTTLIQIFLQANNCPATASASAVGPSRLS